MSNLPATILSEIDSIQEVMRTDRAAYNRDAGMQARYRSLVAQQAGSAPTILSDGDQAPLLPTLSPSQFAAETGSVEGYDTYRKMMRTAADWIFALPASEQRSFIAKFEALPGDVTFAALTEMMRHPPHVPPSSARAIDAFRELPEGAVLAREWGHLCGLNLAVVRARLFRVLDDLEEGSIRVFLDWLDGLSIDAAIALYRKLAG